MSLLLWIVDQPLLAALVLAAGAAVLAAALCLFVHFVLDPAAHGLARLVRDVREPSGRHRRIGTLPPPCGLEVPPRPDVPPPGCVWIAPADDTDTQPIPQIQETAA